MLRLAALSVYSKVSSCCHLRIDGPDACSTRERGPERRHWEVLLRTSNQVSRMQQQKQQEETQTERSEQHRQQTFQMNDRLPLTVPVVSCCSSASFLPMSAGPAHSQDGAHGRPLCSPSRGVRSPPGGSRGRRHYPEVVANLAVEDEAAKVRERFEDWYPSPSQPSKIH